MSDINTLSHTTWRCNFHIVFAPKYRRMVIYGKIKEDIGKIAELQLNAAVNRLASNNIQLTYTTEVLHFLTDNGYQPEYGGRPVKRVIDTQIIDKVSSALIHNEITKEQKIKCDVKDGHVVFVNIPDTVFDTATL